MRRAILWTCIVTSLGAAPLPAGTFDRAAIAPEAGIEALTRGSAREHLGRDLFARPYATVTLGRVDIYDVFPYVETRTVQVVSDPRWHRLVYGMPGQGLGAFDGRGTALGAMRGPRGLAVDERNRIYVADAGNNRVLVLQADWLENGVRLAPLFEIRGLGDPQAVAFSDGGTPFVHDDDRLYVADTGRNRVVAFVLAEDGAREVAAIGTLGSGPGRFAGPLALAVGRQAGAHTRDVFVGDAHTRRLVRLEDAGNQLVWREEVRHDLDVVTSVDVDHWGNLYVAAPRQGLVRKFSPALERLADLHDAASRPRGFHVPFVTVRDHRDGRTTRVGRANGVALDDWNEDRGLHLWTLGLDVADFRLESGAEPAAHFTLTDPAAVSYTLTDAGGAVVARRSLGLLAAGMHRVLLPAEDLGAARGDVLLRMSATSRYAGGPTASAAASFSVQGGILGSPTTTQLLGSSPNPARAFARIAFVVAGHPGGASLGIYDAGGRRVRAFASGFAAGRNEVVWDGRDEQGARMAPGVYFYRLTVNGREYADRLVLTR